MSLYVMNDDGSDVRLLAKVPGHDWHGSHAWSRDGKHIAFDAYPKNLAAARIFMTDGNGENLQDLGYGVRPDFSPDGKQIVFFGLSPNQIGLKVGVWVMNLDGTSREWICEGTSPRWSPDGAYLAITRNTPRAGNQRGKGELILYDMAAGTERVVYSGKYDQISGSTWSPDSKQIAFHGFVSGRGHLTIVPLDDLSKTHVEREGNYGDHCPAWCPDGERMGLCEWENGQLRIFTIKLGSKEPPVYLTGPEGGQISADPSWSPDGKRLVFGSNRGT